MKRTYFQPYFKLIASIGISLAAILYACKKDFLERAPLASLNESDLANAAGVRGLLIGAYSYLDGNGGVVSNWSAAGSNWVYGSVAADDAYKGSDAGDQPDIVPIETYTANSTNPFFNDKWRAVYDGAQRANAVLRILPEVTDLSDSEKVIIAAEARFLRGHYHFEAKKMWGNVPFVDESVTYVANNYKIGNDQDIWPKIEEDFQYGYDNLPAVQSAVGKANKWAAASYLAKAYMFEHKYAEAKALFDIIIANGVTAGGKPYALVNFADNFNAETKNSAEAIFSIQSSVNDNSTANPNGRYGDVLNFPYNGGPGTCCGFFQPSQSLVNSYRVDANGLPFLDTWNDVDVKSDQGIKSSDPYTPDLTIPLDPRLDWTVGRRGIPYLDWGPHPGQNWIRDQAYSGPYAPVKNVYYKRQQGSLTDKSFWAQGITANNYTLIRFADVLLMAAEAEVELGNLPRALELVNQVRGRMSNPASWVHTYIDPNAPEKGFTTTPAANYRIGLYTSFPNQDYARKAVRFERKLELAMEGHRFFDLQRYGTSAEVLNAYIAKERGRRTFFANAVFTKGKNEFFPIPQSQIDLSQGALKQNPGY